MFTLTGIIFTLFQLGLTLNALLFQSRNVTYVELMKGTFKYTDSDGVCPNPYDLGFLTNFATIYEGEQWTFWLPTTHVPFNDGTKYPMLPIISESDKKKLFKNIQEELKEPI